MAKIQSISEPAIAPYLLDPETVQAIDEGFKSAIRQGFSQVIVDSEDVHSDWYADAAACKVAITLVHGSNDQTTSIASVREFAEDFPEMITLIEVADAGSFLHVTHEDLYIRHLKSFARDRSPAT
jgi:pimeloyl-ACP methyl ester carboxylesterase